MCQDCSFRTIMQTDYLCIYLQIYVYKPHHTKDITMNRSNIMDLPHLFHSSWGHILPDKDLTQNKLPTGKYILYLLYVYIISSLKRQEFTFALSHSVLKAMCPEEKQSKVI